MTVATETNRNDYNGNGSTTEFSVTFPFIENSHVKVILTTSAGVETAWVENTDYTLTGAGEAGGGTLTATTAPATGETLTFLRDVPETQATDYAENDSSPAETLERALDKLTMISQQLREKFNRIMTLPESSTISELFFEEPVAGKTLQWKSDLSGLENVDSPAVAQAAAAASASDASDSADEAAISAAAAAASYDDFDDRYLGDKASDPALDNDGDALIEGALYFNTTLNRMKVYNGASWQLTTADAADVAIADAGSHYTGTDVETALQEIGDDITDLETNTINTTDNDQRIDASGTATNQNFILGSSSLTGFSSVRVESDSGQGIFLKRGTSGGSDLEIQCGSTHDIELGTGAPNVAKAIVRNSGGVSITNNAPATPTANTLYADSMVKASASIAFSGSTPSIDQDVNVATITDLGTGRTRLNFATNMATATYQVLATLAAALDVTPVYSRTTSTCEILTYDSTPTITDAAFSAAILGTQ